MSRLNPSYSKTYLTRNNYRGPTLLRSVRGQEEETLPRVNVSDMAVQKELQSVESDPNLDDNLIFAPPESSSDESDHLPTKPSGGFVKPQQIKPAAVTKRPATSIASSRPKRLKLKDEPALVDFHIREDPALNDIFDFPSSGSQRKRQKVYGKKTPTSTPVEDAPEAGLKEDDPTRNDHRRKSGKNGARSPHNIEPFDLQSPPRRTVKNASKMIIPPSPGVSAKLIRPTTSEFRTFDIPDFPSTSGTDITSTLDVFDSPEKPSRQRSGSTSTLSSINSMVILDGEVDYKAPQDPEPSGAHCPLCGQSVHDSLDLFVPENLQTLPFQQQQKFCTEHKVADAKLEWESRGYPVSISWDHLERTRIPLKLAHLKKVISRETDCYYRQQLESEIKAWKGNHKARQRYLNEGVTNIAKPGYYGPKGATIMVNAITASLAETLNKAKKSDVAVRTIGTAAYVSAVLLPELTLQFVMDDMKARTAEDGRVVMEESTDVGVLLNPDDDEIQSKEKD